MLRRIRSGWAAFGAGLALALGLQGSAAQTAPLEKITLAGWSKPITEITHLLVEEEMGFFRKWSLSLFYLPGMGGGDALRNVLSGQGDVAFTDPGSFFAALDKGARLRAIYDVYPQNVFNVVAKADSGIRHASDLKGKTIGVYSLSSGTRQNLLILLQQAGLDEDDVTIVVTGLLNFAPLMQGRVDATAATDTGLALAKRRGLRDVNVLEVADCLNYSSDLLVVTEDYYQQNKDKLRRFLAAYRDAAQWMMDEPERAAQLATRRALDGQDVALNEDIIRLRNRAGVSAFTQQYGLGALDTESLQAAADAYLKLGLISRPIDISDVVAADLQAGADKEAP